MKATLKSIRFAENGSTVCLRVQTEEGICPYRITARDYEALGTPDAGTPLDDGALAAIGEAAGTCAARTRALRMLAYGDNSEKGLLRKLRARGTDPDAAAAAVREMRDRGYIREDEQAYRLVLREAKNKLRGPRRILAELVSRGYSAATARAAISRAEEEGEVDFDEIAARLVEQKLGPDPGREEEAALLWKQGF